jgi:hypothetical protein
MKRLLKLPLKALWRLTRPVRRPIIRKIEALIRRSVPAPPPPPPPPPAPQIHLTCEVTEKTGLLLDQANLLMDHMVRELFRLQSQVERLQQSVEDLTPAITSLNIVGRVDDESLAG